MKRRRPSNVRHHPVKLFYGGKEHGLVLDNGIFISRIVPGSAAAKEGSLLPGDRILYVSIQDAAWIGSGVLWFVYSERLRVQIPTVVFLS